MNSFCLKVSLCAAAVLAALPAASAPNNSLPVIDLKLRCQISEQTMIDMMGDKSFQGSAFDTCMKSESDARDALSSAWKEIPPSYRDYCIRPADYSPSYVEWIACIELMIDLRKQRASAIQAPARIAWARCPGMQYEADGSIKAIKACAL